MANADGTTTPLYDAAKTINPKFVAIAEQVQSLAHIGAYHVGDLPWGFDGNSDISPKRLPHNSPFTLSPTLSDTTFVTDQPIRGALLGLWGSDDELANATRAFVVNLDYSHTFTTIVTGPSDLSIFDPTTGTWIAQGHAWATLALEPGGGILVGLTSAVPEPSTIVLVLTGMIGLLVRAWRRRK